MEINHQPPQSSYQGLARPAHTQVPSPPLLHGALVGLEAGRPWPPASSWLQPGTGTKGSTIYDNGRAIARAQVSHTCSPGRGAARLSSCRSGASSTLQQWPTCSFTAYPLCAQVRNACHPLSSALALKMWRPGSPSPALTGLESVGIRGIT